MPQRQRRRKRGPAGPSVPRRATPPFPINLIFNVRAFYMFFIVIMIASMAAVGLGTGGSTNRGTAPDVEDPSVTEPTPNAALTFDKPALTIDGTQPYIATIKTDKGDVKIALSTDAPETVNSFAFLAGNGFYDGTAFFYVDHGFVAQAGDPGCRPDSENVCSGVGGPGYTLKQEEGTALKPEQWAVVAPTLGEGGEDVHGSQFRILFKDDPRVTGQGTVFGRVVEGQDILEGLSDLAPCEVVTSEDCDPDLSSALVIRDVVVEPATAVSAP